MGTVKSTMLFNDEVRNTTQQNCPSSKCVNDMQVGNVTMSGKRNTATLRQRCVAETECLLNVAYDTASKLIVANETAAGSGGSADNYTEIHKRLVNSAEQNCGTQEARNKMKIGTLTFTETAEDNVLDLIQEGDAKAQCVMGMLSKTVEESEAKSVAKGSDWFTWLIIGLVVVAVIAVLFMLL